MKRSTYWAVGVAVLAVYWFVAGYAHGFWNAVGSLAFFLASVGVGWEWRGAKDKP